MIRTRDEGICINDHGIPINVGETDNVLLLGAM